MKNDIFKEPEAKLFRCFMYNLYDKSERINYTVWANDETDAKARTYPNVDPCYVIDEVRQIWPRKER